MEYFSDKEQGPKARIERQISPEVWAGIVAHIQALISKGGFGEDFPEICHDGAGTIGTDEKAFSQALKAEIPDIEWPLQLRKNQDHYWFDAEPYAPDTFVILDLIQFCYLHVSKPIQCGYHAYFKHHHLSFDAEAGRYEFRETINRIFSRNGIGFELEENGNIKRLAAPVIGEEFEIFRFDTGDTKLDEILEDARRKYLSTNKETHKEAVERLWDAWERLKTLENPNNKKDSITKLLNKAASENEFRTLLEVEAKELTSIGNKFHIRHTEIGKIEIERVEQFDYLFHRLFSMVLLLMQSRA